MCCDGHGQRPGTRAGPWYKCGSNTRLGIASGAGPFKLFHIIDGGIGMHTRRAGIECASRAVMGERERDDRDSFLCKEDKMALEVDSPGIVGDGRPRKQH